MNVRELRVLPVLAIAAAGLVVGLAVPAAAHETRHLISLRAFASLDDVELYFIAFFESFVAVKLNGAVVDEDVRSVITA